MKNRDSLTLASLMLAGECIFILPFLVSRIFRPTFLTVFEINNFQLGTAFSLYGIVAMLSYFLGGPIADRFSPKKLLTVSLLVTAAGGVFMASIPSIKVLTILYGFWGFSTILLFWAAFIKATRIIGGETKQGKSFGLVDGGRGLVAAILASASVFLFSYLLPINPDEASYEQLANALGKVILLFSALTTLSALTSYLATPNITQAKKTNKSLISLEGILLMAKKRTVWLQALIVLCSYVGYKCTDDFSLYAKEVLGYNDVESAHIATLSFWMRPLAAVLAGYLGDRFRSSKIISYSFILVFICTTSIGLGILENNLLIFSVLTIALCSIGIYGLRGLYFTLLQESKIPLLYTGSAVGIISVIGYTPDVFFGPLMGIVLDENPGALGHQILFGIVAAFSLIGFVAVLGLNGKRLAFNDKP